MTDVHPATHRLVNFLDTSPTPFHAVAEVARQLESRGFRRLELSDERGALPAGTRAYVADAGSLFAFRLGRLPLVDGGWRIVAAHTDSPNLRLKPQPLVRNHGYVRLGLEVYGGVQVPTWVDRDLGMAGLVHLRDPSAPDGMRSERVCLRQPLCRIPTLAIHLNRTVNDEGLKLNKQTHLPAVFSLESDNEDPLRSLLAGELDVDPALVLTWDMQLFDLQRPALAGARQEFVHSARLDNLASSHAGLEALLDTSEDEPGDATTVLALFDHEEIGSQTARGANSRAIESILKLTLEGHELQGAGSFSRALAKSWLVSADMAHAVHPAFADKHDKEHMPLMNAGPVIKQNANQRYSTEGETSARWMLLCERAEVPVQWYIHRTDLRCGSTVGPMLAARLGVRSIDVGNAMLSMHSVREQCGAEDHPWMIKAMSGFFRS